MTREEWLAEYDRLEPLREEVQTLFAEAEEHGNYYTADEAAADLNEKLADLADCAAEILRGSLTQTEVMREGLRRAAERGEFA